MENKKLSRGQIMAIATLALGPLFMLWGNRFKVEGLVSTALNGKVFVYSFGPDEIDNHGDEREDIISWK